MSILEAHAAAVRSAVSWLHHDPEVNRHAVVVTTPTAYSQSGRRTVKATHHVAKSCVTVHRAGRQYRRYK